MLILSNSKKNALFWQYICESSINWFNQAKNDCNVSYSNPSVQYWFTHTFDFHTAKIKFCLHLCQILFIICIYKYKIILHFWCCTFLVHCNHINMVYYKLTFDICGSEWMLFEYSLQDKLDQRKPTCIKMIDTNTSLYFFFKLTTISM